MGYLGHIISKDGLSVDPDKITVIQQWPTPRSVKDVRGFLGLVGYYRCFIHNYAQIVGPLIDLLCKDAYCWTEVTQFAFDNLRQLLSTAPVLALPKFSQFFTVETDALGRGG